MAQQKRKLNANEQDKLRKASRQAIESRLLALSASAFTGGSWLPNTNRYAQNFADVLKQDLKNNTCIEADLADYTAVSVILHCTDGWSYLGRALDCCLHGDANTACHLAYYAELRAAMSLLAGGGICIGNTQHVIVDDAFQQYGHINGGTHDTVWPAFDFWSQTSAASGLLSRTIAPRGISLDRWILAFPSGSNVVTTAQSWLQSWGLDLQRLWQDRDMRNHVSYRPNHLNVQGGVSGQDAIDSVVEFWRMCDPSPTGAFARLDEHLLHQHLGMTFKTINPQLDACLGGQDYQCYVAQMLAALSIQGQEASVLKQFLTDESSLSALVVKALRQDPVGTPGQHVQVMCRATLLLRLATGACLELLNAAALGRDDISFWWCHMGEELGLWPPGNPPSTCADLRADIDASLLALDGAAAGSGNRATNLCQWRRDNLSAIPLLGECERVALWGLGL